MRRLFLLMAVVGLVRAALGLVEPSVRPTRLDDLPESLRSRVASSVFEFDAWRDQASREAAARLAQGEHEHLIYFLLQSNSFTSRSPIDPLESARQGAAKDFAATVFVKARFRDFLAALDRPAEDVRLTYWQTHLGKDQRTPAALEDLYRETMQTLSRKGGEPDEPGSENQRRGLGTDAPVRVNYTVWAALNALKQFDPPARLENVLIVGPGQDFAPRTGFRDDSLPQSYEPYLTADAILQLQLSEEQFLRIHCVDINPRVLESLRELKRSSTPRLVLPFEVADAGYRTWFDRVGRGVGIANAEASRTLVSIRPTIVKRITGEDMNIVTQRLVPSPEFDLVVSTNVLSYWRDREVALALANTHSMMKTGGYLIVNNRRASLLEAARTLGLEEVRWGTVKGDMYSLLRKQ